MRFGHILCPTDFSDGSEAAFKTAVELAQDSGARLTILHVHHVPATALPDMFFAITPELLQDTERSLDGYLAQLVDRARAAGVPATQRTLFGSTHREICAVAAELGVDLIVIGTHGRTGLSHALRGSVAERVVRHASCPVLAVHPRAAAVATP
jgi:nucleotide-binding universal stress UspA family protein